MSAFNDFIIAAGAYFGIPDDQLMQGSTVDVSTGEMEVVLRVALTSENVTAIGQLMARMALEAKVDAQVAQAKAEAEAEAAAMSDEDQRMALRAEYNALTASERSAYGSFYRFLQVRMAGLINDPYVPEPVAIPDVVWLEHGEATEQQRYMAVGLDEKGRVGVDPADLTEEQRAKRGVK